VIRTNLGILNCIVGGLDGGVSSNPVGDLVMSCFFFDLLTKKHVTCRKSSTHAKKQLVVPNHCTFMLC